MNLRNLSWDDIVDIIEEADGYRPSNAGDVEVKFRCVDRDYKNLPGWCFLYALSYTDVYGQPRTDIVRFYLASSGKIEICDL